MHYFSRAAFIKILDDVASFQRDLNYAIQPYGFAAYFPFPESATAPAFPAVGIFRHLNHGKKQHLVGLCRRLDLPDSYFPICGVAAFSGTWSVDVMARRMEEASACLPNLADVPVFCAKVKEAINFFPGEDSPCGFWRDYLSNKKPLGCKHVASVASFLKDAGEILTTLDQIDQEALSNSNSGPAVEIVPKPDDILIQTFARVCPADAKGRRKFPVLIQGTHGAGKTYGARLHGETGGFDAVIEAHGHAGIEAVDFLGGMLPMDGDKSLSWVDGPIAEAFRRSALGQRVLLIVDEIYRVPRRERSLFLSALSPALRPDGTLVYRIKTGRPISPSRPGLMPTMELIEAPESHLSIIATTNVGIGYDVEDDDPAESSRWHKIHYAPGDVKTLEVLSVECTNLKLPATLAASLIQVVKNLRKLRMDGEVRLIPSTRELVRAVHIAVNAAEVKSALLEMSHAWVGLDTNGEPNAEQMKAVKAAINAALK